MMDLEIRKQDDGTGYDRIGLDENNMLEYGFSRFCYPEEKKDILSAGYRNVFYSDAPVPGMRECRIYVPRRLLIDLSTKNDLKISRLSGFKIDHLQDRIDIMNLLSSRAGWNQTAEDLRLIAKVAGKSAYLAKIRINGEDIALGCGAVVPAGINLSWVSMILVHQEVRRQGIAAALMHHCLEKARAIGYPEIIGLDATPQGKKLYQKIGFKTSFPIWRCLIPLKKASVDPDRFRVGRLSSYADVRKYLEAKGFQGKESLFGYLINLSPDSCFIATSGNEVAGMVLSRKGAINPFAGPLIANGIDAAMALVARTMDHWKAKNADYLLMDIPERHLSRFENTFLSTDYFQQWEAFRNERIKALRKFDRMYYLVPEKEPGKTGSYMNQSSREKRISEMTDLSDKLRSVTKEYMEREKKSILRYMYAIAGPEYG